MAENALIIPETVNALAVFGDEGGVDKVLDKLRADALGQAEALDISTETGRKSIASLAFKVARSKTALDDMGKSLVEGWKTQAAKVDRERRRIREECDRIRDEVRKPLDDYEAEVKAFNDKWTAETKALEALGEGLESASLPDIQERLRRLTTMAAMQWPLFFKPGAEKIGRSVKALLEQAQHEIERLEADAAQKRAEAAQEAARVQKEREDAIAKEAAERASRDAAAALEREKERTAREKAKREADAIAAKEREKQAVERAKETERLRIAKEQERERQAAEKREANERNRRKVLKAITEALWESATDCGCTLNNQQLGAITEALGAGKIPHVTIQW